jgi:phosphoglycerate dehydrogenase-like enzyme
MSDLRVVITDYTFPNLAAEEAAARRAGAVYGFFGFGQIGRAVHLRLRGFGFRFMASDPALPCSLAAELGVELVDADTLFRSSDLVFLVRQFNCQAVS